MRAVIVENLCEKYRIKFITEGKVSWEEIWALQDINLNINQGEVVGIIGHNGAGKTTFLRLLAGMLVPDKGEVNVQGKVTAIMELGAGLNPEFTGRENIILNARVYGIEEEILKQKIDEIIIFSNLGKFIDAPIKYYSQGMYMRLAFALAIFAEPDILLIDDILAVGDEEAQQKCKRKIVELKEAGKTIILVSHDMGMINKLCDRAILFEKGRIIKEGHPQSVIPYYLETAGEKFGIALLEQQGLRVVFNNGRLSIAYTQNFISSSVGGYCASFDNLLKIHSPSTNLFWKIKSILASELIAEGKSSEDGVPLQYFRINLQDNILDLTIRNFEIPPKQHNFNLFLVANYDRWILADKEGCFPEFSHRTNWHDFGLNLSSSRKLGIFTGSENLLPALIFEAKAEDSSLKIFNSGYDQESRIIHLSSSNSRELSLNIRVCLEKEDFDNFFIQEQKFWLIQQQEEERLAREEAERIRQIEEDRRIEEERLAREEAERIRQIEEDRRIEEERLAREEAERQEHATRELYLRSHIISRGDCRLFVDKDNSCLRVYFKDKEITSEGGINSIFPSKHLIGYYWHAEKLDQDELLLSLESDSLKQFWRLKFQQDNILTIKIAIEIKNEIPVVNRFIRLELINSYDLWETPYEKGLFSDAEYINDISPVRLKDVRVCQVAAASSNKEFPRIIFEVLGKEEQYAAGVFRQQQSQEASCISFCPILPWSNKLLPAGKHDFFEGRIIFDSQDKLEDKGSEKFRVLIGDQSLRFSFNSGRGNIVWKGKTLSSGLGVYTALRSQNIWYDSTQAAWRYIKKNKKRMVIEGRWPHIPVSQIWDLEVISDDSIHWKVEMEVYSQVNIEIEQASIMLINEYREWFIENSSNGKFLDEFTKDYDILPFRYWYGLVGKNGLGVTGNSLPKIIFTNTMCEQMAKGLLENSDFLHCSRIIQYQKYNNEILLPKKYSYFSGLIKIEDK